MLRGALVLALAALDALVLDCIIDSIPALARRGLLGRNFEKWVGEEPRTALEAFAGDNPLGSLQDLGRLKLAIRTFQRAGVIEGVLRDTVGADPPWAEAAAILGSPWTAEQVKDRLDAFVARRNDIVHRGDLVSGRKSTRPIQRTDVQDAVDIVNAVGEAVIRSVSRRGAQ